MTYDEFNTFCESQPATSYVIQWNNSHVWKVGGKVFAIGGWGRTTSLHLSSRRRSNFDFLKEEPGYKPAPTLLRIGMKLVQLFESTPKRDEELRYYLTESHRIVSLGLTKETKQNSGSISSQNFCLLNTLLQIQIQLKS
ncbi:MmcQ/YjbR family DNA-binding protein [Vibrio lentus]|nr:MmcQ/YjbR family DNA-binding protein [Vibrio lentus]